jgi:hypothetical protein
MSSAGCAAGRRNALVTPGLWFSDPWKGKGTSPDTTSTRDANTAAVTEAYGAVPRPGRGGGMARRRDRAGRSSGAPARTSARHEGVLIRTKLKKGVIAHRFACPSWEKTPKRSTRCLSRVTNTRADACPRAVPGTVCAERRATYSARVVVVAYALRATAWRVARTDDGSSTTRNLGSSASNSTLRVPEAKKRRQIVEDT